MRSSSVWVTFPSFVYYLSPSWWSPRFWSLVVRALPIKPDRGHHRFKCAKNILRYRHPKNGDVDMRKLFKFYLSEIRDLRKYVLSIVFFLVVSYSVYLIFDESTISQLGREDGVFEYLTALFFLTTSIVFFRMYLSQKNLLVLLLSIVFFFGFGEEIAWGQRILGYHTPEFIHRINVQHDFTLHNIEIFNAHDFDHNLKTGFDKLLTITFLYKLFWLGYCVLLPIGVIQIRSVSSLVQKIRLPIPPLSIGVFFLVNWLIFRITRSFLLPPDQIPQYYYTLGEIREMLSALLFMILSFYFLKKTKWGHEQM